MLRWILSNKEWFLSGAGLFILTAAFALIRRFLSRKPTQPTITIGHNTGQIVIGTHSVAMSSQNSEDASVAELIRVVELRRDDVNQRLENQIRELEAELEEYRAEGLHFREDGDGPSIEFIGGYEWHFRRELLAFKADFNSVVDQKLSALRSGQLVLAHELTVKVHKLAHELEVRGAEAKQMRDLAATCSISAMNAAAFRLAVASFLKVSLAPYVQAIRPTA